jgi:hypothetical protein
VKLYTSKEVAAMLGKSRVSILKLSERYGIGAKIGRDWVYTDEEVRQLKHWRKPGRPAGKRPAT